MTNNGRAATRQKIAIVAGLAFLVALGIVEFTMYRPQQARLRASEAELKSLQSQLAALARRKANDASIMDAMANGPEGEDFRAAYSSKSGLVYLNQLIDRSRLIRVDFRTESSQQDGAFRVERYYVTLRGRFPTVLNFVKSVETGVRLCRIEEFRMDPVASSTQVFIKFRIGVYSLPQAGAGS